MLAGQYLHYVVPAGVWFGATPCCQDTDFSLAGGTVAPGFDFRNFEMGKKAELKKAYPLAQQGIDEFSRQEQGL